ncbi:motile sperm domain-containing protein 2 [Daphnia magna]|uniref:Uncharacterized protein n=2 Tax=Daphnia magna TaxID=35525 RepID=A0ABQ9YUM4_9CRUS|nr:motile sperm domain-containing protein 2 [Daphnia magna]XP_032791618.1 motile sperm domain-containing protein 2 [Daphnia magna]KAK4004350.1 hypothetical protein OUZ56_006087 [Daphnia magna]KZS22072.1 Motile sperm domain-containing protein 2 [Daphnia magna]
MEPSEEDILEVRQRAIEKIESPEQDLQSIAHPKDLERLKNDKDWVRRFLLHHDLDKEKAVNMIIGTLKWRQKFGANDISHSNINQQIVCAGGMFPHCKDKDGKPLFIVKVKSSVKGTYKSEEIHKVLVYWFDRLEKQEKGGKISVFFEMTGAGLSNMDMEFVQYLIMLFRDYYPYFLNYIIIFEMSWILNAAWKVIKSWMPAKSVNMVKFVGRSDLKDFVPVTEQLAEWGGSVNYHFVFEPEFLPASGPVNLNGQFDDSRKKVHFAEGTTSNETTSTDSSESVKKPVPGQYLQLAPAEEIVFRREDGETTGTLVMNNAANCNVAYKIKTTSPDKYRVRPSAGIICTGASLNVTVHIQSGYSASQLVRDKFLVMACTVESDSLTNLQLSEVWKKTNENTIQQHRLRCSVAPSDAKDDEFAGNLSGLNNAATAKLLQDIAPQLNRILDEQQNLRKQLKSLRTLLFILIILSLVVPFYFFNSDPDVGNLSCRA